MDRQDWAYSNAHGFASVLEVMNTLARSTPTKRLIASSWSILMLVFIEGTNDNSVGEIPPRYMEVPLMWLSKICAIHQNGKASSLNNVTGFVSPSPTGGLVPEVLLECQLSWQQRASESQPFFHY